MKQLLTALLAFTVSFTAWAENPQVELTTIHGSIIIELDAQAAPISVENFLYYANSDYYNDTIFHRVIPGFMVQGGEGRGTGWWRRLPCFRQIPGFRLEGEEAEEEDFDVVEKREKKKAIDKREAQRLR